MIVNLLLSALVLFLYMNLAFAVGSIKKNNAVIDSFYGSGYVVIAWTSFLLSGTFLLQKIIVTILVTIWGIRLSGYVTIRNWGKPEDYRYKAMRERYGDKILIKSYLKIYIFQGIIIYLVCFPVLFINSSTIPILTTIFEWSSIFLMLGTCIWLFGFYFEAVGDSQLRKFLKTPENKGKVMDKGLWRYTQHPNYFGEVTMWWGIYVIALVVPWGFLTIFGPIVINFMIIRVSGVRLLNKRFDGDDIYAEYRRRTSSFIPWFPKKK